jgi:hypothetical protein
MRERQFTVAQNSAITLATQVVSYSLNLVAGIIIARNLGPAGKGNPPRGAHAHPSADTSNRHRCRQLT